MIPENADYQVQDGEPKSNTDTTRRQRIESLADLEDFAPMELRISPYQKNLEMKLKLRAVGLEVNLFPGYWSDDKTKEVETDYLFDLDKARQAVRIPKDVKNTSVFPLLLEDTLLLSDAMAQTKIMEIPLDEIKMSITTPDEAYVPLIFEGVSSRYQELCDAHPDKCYIEAIISVEVDGREVQVAAERLHMVLKPIAKLYQHYTVGDKEDGYLDDTSTLTSDSQTYDLSLVPTVHDLVVRKEDRKDQQEPEHVVFVHGWRMQRWERRRFAETAYKRLYWQGYRGYFTFWSWPTEWFDINAYDNFLVQLFQALKDYRNYDRSEAVARRAGEYFLDFLESHNLDGQKNNTISVVAHSMGNIVVSEALRKGLELNKTNVIDNYIAMQSAEAAHAFNPAAPKRTSLTTTSGLIPCNGDCNYNYVNWSTSNLYYPPTAGTSYHWPLPPDFYSYGDVESAALLGNSADPDETLDLAYLLPIPPEYYHWGVKKLVKTNMVSFINGDDDALSGWKWNQMLKPDTGTRFTQNLYVQEYLGSLWTEPEPLIILDDAVVGSWLATNTFEIDPKIRLSEEQLAGADLNIDDAVVVDWNMKGSKKTPNNPGFPDRADILAFVIPARSYALGATMKHGVEFNGGLDLGGDINDPANIVTPIGKGGYDHAAAFLSYNMERYYIWWNFIDKTPIISNRRDTGQWKKPD